MDPQQLEIDSDGLWLGPQPRPSVVETLAPHIVNFIRLQEEHALPPGGSSRPTSESSPELTPEDGPPMERSRREGCKDLTQDPDGEYQQAQEDVFEADLGPGSSTSSFAGNLCETRSPIPRHINEVTQDGHRLLHIRCQQLHSKTPPRAKGNHICTRGRGLI